LKILGLLFTAGIILVILGVALSIGSKVTQDVGGNVTIKTSTILNEAVSANNETTATLSLTGGAINKALTSCLSVTNSSTMYFDSNDYTCGSDGTFTWLNASDPVVDVLVNYSIQWEDWSNVFNTSYQSQIGLSRLANWNSTIATAVAAVVIIGAILSGFAGFLMFRGGRV
jgi:hypothetical protein